MSSLSARVSKQKWSEQTATTAVSRPILLLTINNGAGHTRAAEAIADAWREKNSDVPAQVVDVSDFMSPLARFTHVTAYLWLVKNAPRIWDKIEAYQKRQTNTSPEWFYRRECRKLFDLAREIQPTALVVTEVGCCEIAALIKRDLNLNIPLVAVNVNYDADRAWIQPEVDFYSVAFKGAREELVALGANVEKIKILGAPMASEFGADYEKNAVREKICRQFDFQIHKPILLIAGGSEGMGKIEKIVRRLLDLNEVAAQLIVLAGRNTKLKTDLEKLAQTHKNGANVKVLGWTCEVPNLMRAADLMISKLGNTFDESLAIRLPIIALEPPPGSERVQYALLNEWKTGCAVNKIDDLEKIIIRLLKNPEEIKKMRDAAQLKRKPDAADQIVAWLDEEILTKTNKFEVSRNLKIPGENLTYFEAKRW